MTTFSGIASSSEEFKETCMSMYLQDFIAGPNVTDIPVAGVAGKLWSFRQFGTIYVTDNPLTEGPSLHSPSVGRAQGVFVAAALDGLNALIVFSVRFTNKEYNGSTLEIQVSYGRRLESFRWYPVLESFGLLEASAQAHQAAVTYTLRGYIQNPLYPRPNGSSTISKTFYLTKTPNGYSGVVARWDVLLTPQAGDWESNMALVMGIITPKTSVLDGSGDLQPFAVQGVFNCSDLSGMLVGRSLLGVAVAQAANATAPVVIAIVTAT
ncbi:hypothetical protein ACLB2K_054597 [Fragaria x ananassa]